ncbi:hypothetical protein HDU91_003259 [Kappamyces sp. JEL0680]|nr:hypothetical protein HDU91_003259 [Kappamyces sp. JEL0680]
MSLAARTFLLQLAAWAETQVVLSVLDSLTTWFIFWRVRGPAIFLLAVLSSIKLTNVVWLGIGADYTSDYSDTLVTVCLVGLECGWFVNDHIASVSTLQKLLYLPQNRWRKLTVTIVSIVSVVFGLFLRVGRSACRFGSCMAFNEVQSDIFIVLNIILCELVLVTFLLYFFYEMYKAAPSRSVVVSEMIQQGALRVVILVPLGILEVTAYFIDYAVNNNGASVSKFVVFLLEIGIYARHLYPTLLAIAIAMTKVRVGRSSEESTNKKLALFPRGPDIFRKYDD